MLSVATPLAPKDCLRYSTVACILSVILTKVSLAFMVERWYSRNCLYIWVETRLILSCITEDFLIDVSRLSKLLKLFSNISLFSQYILYKKIYFTCIVFLLFFTIQYTYTICFDRLSTLNFFSLFNLFLLFTCYLANILLNRIEG